MSKLNWTGVILGGLVTGLILNAADLFYELLLVRGAFSLRLEELGITEGGSATGTAVRLTFGFLWGGTAIWLYAAIRPRFGGSPRTALRAAIIVWLLSVLLPAVGTMALGIFSAELMVGSILWALVALCIAVNLGALIYKERDVAAGPQPAEAT